MGVLNKPTSYLQYDSRWANVGYSTAGEITNIKESGCGPTAAAMLAETLTGKTITPVDACRWSLKMGYKAAHQGTYYAFFKPFFAQYGINCYQFNSSNLYGNSSSSIHDEVFSMVDKGWYFIACMGPGTWTSGGHFVLLYGYDKAVNKVYINDPASTKGERTEGNLKTFRSQVKYYFAVDGSEYNKEVVVSIPTNTTYKKIAKIPLKDISKIEIYVNSKKKNLATIKKETGANHIINGGLFNWNWTACPLLKVDGVMVSKDPYSMWGYGWNAGSDIQMSNAHKNFENYIGSPDLINPIEKEKTDLSTNSAFAGKRGRSAMGLTKDSLILFCTKDGSNEALEMSELQQAMFDLECETALYLDSGGSSQADFDSQKITSSRIVHNFILVYTNGNTGVEPSPIAEIQAELNRRYDFGLAEDGEWGPKSRKAMIMAVQTEINNLYGGKLAVDGSWGSKSKAACPDIKSVTKNNLAWLIQACLIIKGYDLELDGSYGPGCATIVGQFQKANGLKSDKICGPNTMTKLLG